MPRTVVPVLQIPFGWKTVYHQILPTDDFFTFSAFWLRSSVVSVLISLISDIGTLCRRY